MVDIGAKTATPREARAEAVVRLPEIVMKAFAEDKELHSRKGPVMQTARLAGTMAVKRTADLIPLCHPIPVEKIDFATHLNRVEKTVTIECTVSAHYKTGVEMEALTGVTVAALTVYDMCKALSPEIEIRSVRVLDKTGGKSDFHAVPNE